MPSLDRRILRSAFAATLAFGVVAAPGGVWAGYIDHFATYDDIGRDKAPGHGVSSVLVLTIIVDEPGLPGAVEMIQAAREFYAPGGSGFTFSNYFETASLGRFQPVVTVADFWIQQTECPFSRDPDTGHCTIAQGDVTSFLPAIRVIRKALETAEQELDLHDFDINGDPPGEPDAVIDGVIVLTNIDFGGLALPHWRLCNGPLTLACIATGSLDWSEIYDGIRVPWVAIAGAQGGSVETALHISVHEFGHLLGFADLYDQSGASTGVPYAVMGPWTYDANPPLPDAFSRYVIGWGNPVQLSGDGLALLRPAHLSGDLLKLGTGDEYFLVEYRVPAAPWDGDLAAAGVAITHVNLAERPSAGDQSYVETMADCVSCEPWSPMVMLEQKDGLYELQSGPDERDDLGDLFRAGDVFPSAPDHAPLSSSARAFDSNRYDGTSTGISVTVTDIDSDRDGVATVEVRHPVLADPCADLLCPAGTCVDGVCDYGNAGAGGTSGTGGDRGDGGTTGAGGTAGDGGAGASGGARGSGSAGAPGDEGSTANGGGSGSTNGGGAGAPGDGAFDRASDGCSAVRTDGSYVLWVAFSFLACLWRWGRHTLVRRDARSSRA